MATMILGAPAVIDMINGRWRSQILYAGVELGVFEHLSDNTARGQLLRSDHPQSFRAMALHEEGPVPYAVWRHLPAMIRSGVQDGFRHEFGVTMFAYLSQDPQYAATFHSALVS